MGKIDINKIRNQILNGNYNIKKEIQFLSYRELSDILFDLAFETENISFYFFISYLAIIEKCPEYHILALSLLQVVFSHIEGVSNISFFHAKEAVRLNNNNISYKISLLDFYNNPSHLLSYEEAMKLSNEILLREPNNKIAKKIIGSL